MTISMFWFQLAASTLGLVILGVLAVATVSVMIEDRVLRAQELRRRAREGQQ